MFTTNSGYDHLLCNRGTCRDDRTYDINIPLHYRWVSITLHTLWTLCCTILRLFFFLLAAAPPQILLITVGLCDNGGDSLIFLTLLSVRGHTYTLIPFHHFREDMILNINNNVAVATGIYGARHAEMAWGLYLTYNKNPTRHVIYSFLYY
jgi:hypothetical protein